jgi:predicted nucleotidyltransferase
MDVDGIIAALVRDLQDVSGVAAIVLGGSRARGTHTAHSDVDLALYYRPDQPLDLVRLGQIAATVDDAHRADAVTEIGGWGPWINGGGWLTVRTVPVDLLYRDLVHVRAVLAECLGGQPRIVYQPGHPHGFVTAIYLAEIALCRVLWDPGGAIADLKRLATPYPAALKAALIRMFFWEADFSLKIAAKAVPRSDVSYVAGCCFRAVSCLVQTLFALNETYWMNEKGSVTIAAAFARTPPRLVERIDGAFGGLAPAAPALERAIAMLAELVAETEALLAQAGFST